MLNDLSKKEFENLGFIKISNFIKDEDFNLLCNNLNNEINLRYRQEKDNINKLGGSLSGNININLGKKGDLIWSFLRKKNIENVIYHLTSMNKNKFAVFNGGNFLFPYPKSHNQIFHTDGRKNPRKIIISLCLNDIDKNNGPTEIYEKSHKEIIPYWKFFFKYFFKKKYKLIIKKGDIFIREAFIWHRGTKNNKITPRVLINFIISEEENIKLPSNAKNEIFFFDNMYKSNFIGKIKEYIDVRLRPLFFIYKFFRSFIN